MHEIKFKAWDKAKKEIFPVTRIFFDVGKVEKTMGVLPHLSYSHLTFEEIELMQFTGLTDKNGKEIYEGDILGCFHEAIPALSNESKTILKNIGRGLIISNARWDGLQAYTEYIEVKIHDIYSQDTDQFAIIGNIYENPELLKP